MASRLDGKIILMLTPPGYDTLLNPIRNSSTVTAGSQYFSITRKGRAVLPESRAGDLYAILFRTYFRSFNLAYLDMYPQNVLLQQTLALTFYRLGRAARSWTDVGMLAERVLLEEVLEQPEGYPIETRRTANSIRASCGRLWSSD